jgi:hypothetical protein
MPRDPSASRFELRNLGPKSVEMLRAAGIGSVAQLRTLGAVAAYVRVKRRSPRASLNLLYALVGALDGQDWVDVRRTRKLELLIAVEDYERQHPAPASLAKRTTDPLLALRNIGPAMRRDFELLGITTVAQLARQHPDRLYARLQELTGKRHDPCVWDTFAAAIHQARTGEALPWWQFTAQRKATAKNGVRPHFSAKGSRRKENGV